MELIKKNKHNSITKKLFETIPGSVYVLLKTSPVWCTVQVKTIYKNGKTHTDWFGKLAIAELGKMANLK